MSCISSEHGGDGDELAKSHGAPLLGWGRRADRTTGQSRLGRLAGVAERVSIPQPRRFRRFGLVP